MILVILQRESIYIWYYLSLQLRLIAPYWGLGILLGSVVSVFGKKRISRLFLFLNSRKLGIIGIIPASLLGIASPLCLYGTLPVAASFSEKGMREDWLAAFMMSSILLNPQLLMFSAILGRQMFLYRLYFSFTGGVIAGILIYIFYSKSGFFTFEEFGERKSKDTHPNLLLRFLLNIFRNIKVTGPYFLAGIVLTAVYQRYVPQDIIGNLFGPGNKGFGVLSAAALGVPLYVCGGGTIPLLHDWLISGMSKGAGVAFMISGPATKLTNLSALKSVLGLQKFILYIGFIIVYAIISGLIVNII